MVANPLNKLIKRWNGPQNVKSLLRNSSTFAQKLLSLLMQTMRNLFKLTTDASKKGLGAVLSQVRSDGKEKPVAFANRTLSKAEKNYTAPKLGFLALKWSLTDRFHEYQYGSTFEVYTDNNPLSYVLSSAKLDATGQRWIVALQ